MPTWEQSTDDLRAVLDTAGSERAAIIGDVDAGPIAVLFAAMQPDRVQALVLSNTTPRFLWAPDYPIGLPKEMSYAQLKAIEEPAGYHAALRADHPWSAPRARLGGGHGQAEPRR